MDGFPTTSLTEVHEAIIAALRARFGDEFVHFGYYIPVDQLTERDEEQLRGPAMLLELDGESYSRTEPGGRLSAECTWIVHCILTIQTEQLQLALRRLGSEIATLLLPHDRTGAEWLSNHWGLAAAIDDPQDVATASGGFTGLAGRDSRLVRWRQTAYLP